MCPKPGLDGEYRQCVVAAAVPAGSVGRIEQGVDLVAGEVVDDPVAGTAPLTTKWWSFGIAPVTPTRRPEAGGGLVSVARSSKESGRQARRVAAAGTVVATSRTAPEVPFGQAWKPDSGVFHG
jgi:hypothetical protein